MPKSIVKALDILMLHQDIVSDPELDDVNEARLYILKREELWQEFIKILTTPAKEIAVTRMALLLKELEISFDA